MSNLSALLLNARASGTGRRRNRVEAGLREARRRQWAGRDWRDLVGGVNGRRGTSRRRRRAGGCVDESPNSAHPDTPLSSEP
eukprot:2357387-Rhodomonas_salina.2